MYSSPLFITIILKPQIEQRKLTINSDISASHDNSGRIINPYTTEKPVQESRYRNSRRARGMEPKTMLTTAFQGWRCA